MAVFPVNAAKKKQRGIIMNRIREWLMRFMAGRYGVDQMGKTMNWAILIFLVLAMFTGNMLFELIGVGLLIYTYFRIFSRNHSARYQENQRYLLATADIRRRWNSFVNVNRQRKDFHIYTCPNKSCKQKIRVPKGKGRIQVTCPKCRTQFIKNS